MPRPPRSKQGKFDCWEVQRLWGITETGVTRAREMVLKRAAILMVEDPGRFLTELTAVMGEARGDRLTNIATWNAAMDRADIELLARMKNNDSQGEHLSRGEHELASRGKHRLSKPGSRCA